MSNGAKLRATLAEGLVVAPFVYDGFTALIAEAQGAKAVYMTGHGTSAQLGLPDVGLTSMAEMVAISREIFLPLPKFQRHEWQVCLLQKTWQTFHGSIDCFWSINLLSPRSGAR